MFKGIIKMAVSLGIRRYSLEMVVSRRIRCHMFHNNGFCTSGLVIDGNHGKLSIMIERSVFLMGSPGSGKTTIATIIGQRFGLPVIDVDEYLEKRWKTTVAEKLSQLGDDAFLAEEGEAVSQLSIDKPCIVSLSGSNPLHAAAMKHVRSLGNVIFIDAASTDILSRLSVMKVDRIVGQGRTIADILAYRQKFYEGSYDIRVICNRGEVPESIADKVEAAINRLESGGDKFKSTRSIGSNVTSFKEMLLQGGASDGGLFVPVDGLPRFSVGELSRLTDLSHSGRALRILEKLIHPCDIPPSVLSTLVECVYSDDAFQENESCKIESLGSYEFVLELFRGPTGSFKDHAARILPHVFQYSTKSAATKYRNLVLAATSGDTGSAIAQSFASMADANENQVLVLYPENGVSEIAKLQLLASRGPTVSVVGIDGDFDVCQSIVKRLLTDHQLSSELKETQNCRVTVANSINWMRLIGQMVYHVSGYLDLVKHGAINVGDGVDICIPSGNFGNILSAYYCKTMGLPIRKLICASNDNNVLTEFVNTGYYNIWSRGQSAVKTVSPAIDIVRASNVERYIYSASRQNSAEVCRVYQDLQTTGRFQVSPQVRCALQQDFLADWCSVDTCLQTIRDTYEQSGYLLDPHTAVAKAVANKFRSERGRVPLLIYATAHYAKCPGDVLLSLTGSLKDIRGRTDPTSPSVTINELHRCLVPGTRPAMHSGLSDVIFRDLKLPPTVLPADFNCIVEHIRSLMRNSL